MVSRSYCSVVLLVLWLLVMRYEFVCSLGIDVICCVTLFFLNGIGVEI